MPKVAVLIPCYGSTDYLRPVIKQYLRLDKILVMNYLFPCSEPFPDNTKQICSEFGIECISGEGEKQESVLNKGLEMLRDYQTIFLSDADEFIMRADQDKMIERHAKSPENFVTVPMIEYAGDLHHKYVERGHKPPVLCNPQAKFYEVRCAEGCGSSYNDIYMHHLGFLANQEKIEWKRKKQIKTNRFDVVNELMNRLIESYEPPQELLDLLR